MSTPAGRRRLGVCWAHDAPVRRAFPSWDWRRCIEWRGENSMKLAEKIALITGGSRGIGRATALAFAAEGADIAFCHLNDDAKADETAGEIRALGRRAMHRSVDVADVAASRAFAGQAAREFGPIDILFNNAGINIRKPFEA